MSSKPDKAATAEAGKKRSKERADSKVPGAKSAYTFFMQEQRAAVRGI